MWKSTVLCDVKRLQESSQDLDIEGNGLLLMHFTRKLQRYIK